MGDRERKEIEMLLPICALCQEVRTANPSRVCSECLELKTNKTLE